MQIAGNIVALLLLPVGLIAAMALRDTHHAGGSDAVGPLMILVPAVVLRWLLGAALITLCVGRGGFDGLVPVRGLQVLVLAGVWYALDLTAWRALSAVERADDTLAPLPLLVGRCVGYGLPLLVPLVLSIPLNAPGVAAPAVLRGAVPLVLIAAAVVYVRFAAVDRASDARRAQWLAGYYAAENRVIDRYAPALDAIPPDAPADRYAAFYEDPECPETVRASVDRRLFALPDLDGQLLSMLGDDRRELGLTLVSRTNQLLGPEQVRATAAAMTRLARSYDDRAAGLDTAGQERCARAAMLAVYLTWGRATAGVDFRPAVLAWQAALAKVPPGNDHVRQARRQVDEWLVLRTP